MLKDFTEKQMQASNELVRRGKLRHLLHVKQREVYDFIAAHPTTAEVAIYSARKVGKTFLLAVYGLEQCIRTPNTVVRHVLPSLKNAKDVVIPVVGEILPYLPDEVRPELYSATATYRFPNGSVYILCGAHKDSLEGARGPRCDIFLFDEVAFFEETSYAYAMDSIFAPQQTLVQNPKRIYATTPPVSPAHPFITKTLPRIEAQNAFFKYTIYDSPIISKERIDQIKMELGETSNAWRREYLAELVADDNLRVTPEFNAELHITDELPPLEDLFGKSTIYTGYRVADYGVGAEDYTGLLTGVLDHNAQTLYVVGEQLLIRPVIDTFVAAWYEIETTTLANCYKIEGVIDAFEQLRHTLRGQYELDFSNPKKGKILDNLAFLRNCLENNKVLIHSSCVNLIRQLKEGVWKDNRKDFERSDSLGHLDLLICLVYMVRAVDWNARPGINRLNVRLGANKRSTGNDRKEYFRNLR